jgi:hypothetical protein
VTLKEYESTPGHYRGFCERCGSTLYWRDGKEPLGEVELLTGTLDHEFLVEDGKALCTPTGGRFWCCKEIKGVTTPEAAYGGGPSGGIGGRRLVEGSTHGKYMD